jgi:hypothetical protein
MNEMIIHLIRTWRVDVERTGRITYRLALTNGRSGDRNFTTADYYAWGTRRHAEAKARRILRRFLKEQSRSHRNREVFRVSQEVL